MILIISEQEDQTVDKIVRWLDCYDQSWFRINQLRCSCTAATYSNQNPRVFFFIFRIFGLTFPQKTSHSQ